MKNINIHCYTFDLNFDLYYNQQIDLFIDFYDVNKYINNKSIKILTIIEPNAIHPEFRELAIKHKEYFDYIFTHDEEILNNCKNAVLFEYGTTWIKKDYKFKNKSYGVSTLVGGKKYAEGHLMRQKLWYKQNKIKNIPIRFFLSGNYRGNIENFNNNPILGDDKEPLFDTQYHIAIENSKNKYYFTEKIIDCFQTKTIPIYYGCNNIGDYFDINGIITVDSVNEIINICNSLSKDEYNKRIDSINKNYELSKQWINLTERIKNKIKEVVK